MRVTLKGKNLQFMEQILSPIVEGLQHSVKQTGSYRTAYFCKIDIELGSISTSLKNSPAVFEANPLELG